MFVCEISAHNKTAQHHGTPSSTVKMMKIFAQDLPSTIGPAYRSAGVLHARMCWCARVYLHAWYCTGSDSKQGFAKHLEALNAEAWLQNIEKHANQKSPGHSTNRWRKGLCANPTTKHTTTTLYLRCNMHNRPYETASATQFCCAFLNNFFLYFSFDSSTPNQRVQKTNKPIMNTHTDTLLHRHTITLSTYKTTTTAAAAAATVRTEPHVDPARAQHKLTPINSKTTNPPYAIMANNSQTFWTG